MTSLPVRLATPGDNAALLDLFGRVPMEGGSLVLSTRRDPEFFALYRIQRGVAECWVMDDPQGQGRSLSGMGSVLVRDGWLHGQPCRTGYLGDLRSRFAARRSRGLVRHYPAILEDTHARHGCEFFLTGVLASNAAAMQALVRRRKEREGQPVYHPLRRFTMVSVQFTGRRRIRSGGAFEVRTATAADLPAFRALLDADHRARPFGWRYDDGELEHRLAHWPGFTLDGTYLAFTREGKLVGGTTAWDASAVKRHRVEAYRGGMLWTRRGFNAAARILGWTPLPAAGQDFRYFYLCNTTIQGEDPAVMRALLERIYADFRGRGYHFFSFQEDERDPLAAASKGFFTRRLAFQLFAVARAGGPAPDFGPGRTGFEMALA